MKVLGTKFIGHDSGIFIIDFDNKKLFGILNERISRIKHDSNFIHECLLYLKDKKEQEFDYIVGSFNKFNNNSTTDISYYYSREITYYLKLAYGIKYLKDFQILKKATYKDKIIKLYKINKLSKSIYYFIIYKIIKLFKLNKFASLNKFLINNFLNEKFKKNGFIYKRLEHKEHHLCHAISAYYMSSYNKVKSLVIVIDGQGDGYYHTSWIFDKLNYNKIGFSKAENISRENISIGRVYSLFTEILGFHSNADEGKTEALAAFGKYDSSLLEILNKAFIIDKINNGWKHNYEYINKLYNRHYLLDIKNQIGNENFAATIQYWLENTVLEYLYFLKTKYSDIENLILSGGVVANVIMNMKIFEKKIFKNIYIIPPMGDDGVSIGAAILKGIEQKKDVFWLNKFSMPYFGNEYSNNEIKNYLENNKHIIEYKYLEDRELSLYIAKQLHKGKIISLFRDKMEYGPRALGNRSIIANPTDPDLREKMNVSIKRRPKFQPFCPSILEEERERLFVDSYSNKHMTIAFKIKEEYRNKIPSAIHIDGTARPQFVTKDTNFFYYTILKNLKDLNGFGVVINTSFNLHGRTIVFTPQDAIDDFIDCNIDILVIGNFIVKRLNK